jgi:uncharacterized protein (TIGR02246 family)
VAPWLPAQLTMEAQSEISLIIKALSDSWNSHDMAAYAAQFTEDADFVNVIGMHWKGRPEIEASHVQVHRTIFRNSKLKILDCSLRPLAPGVVLAHTRWEMTGHESPPGVRFSELRHGIISSVFVEREGRWLIAAFQNTDIVPMSLPEIKS